MLILIQQFRPLAGRKDGAYVLLIDNHIGWISPKIARRIDRQIAKRNHSNYTGPSSAIRPSHAIRAYYFGSEVVDEEYMYRPKISPV
jgi:hypothetical protein